MDHLLKPLLSSNIISTYINAILSVSLTLLYVKLYTKLYDIQRKKCPFVFEEVVAFERFEKNERLFTSGG
jgi:hypothetical protein